MVAQSPDSKQLNGGLGSEGIQVTVGPDSGQLQTGWIPVEPDNRTNACVAMRQENSFNVYKSRLVTTFFCLGKGK
jgi:hypothetical protein